MQRLVRVFGYLFIISLWVVVVSLALELTERLRWEYIERTNKYIGIRKGRIPFSEWDPDEKEELFIQYGEGKNLFNSGNLLIGEEFCLLPPSVFEKWSYRLSYYLSSNEEVRKRFKQVYGFNECDLELDKSDLEPEDISCFDVYDGFKRSDFFSMIGKFDFEKLRGEKSKIEMVSGNDGKNYLLYFYFRGSSEERYRYTCFVIPYDSSERWFNPLVENATVNDIAEVPYFIYYPHRSLTTMAFRTNNFGYRDYDFIVPKPKGVFRIVCIGASTTEEGVSNRDTYPKFLERILRDYFKTEEIEVFNCGISGMTLNRHIAKLPEYIVFQPDIVVIYEGVNDIVYGLFSQMFDELPIFVRVGYLISIFARVHLRPLPYFDYPVDRIEERIDEEYMTSLKILVDNFTREGILVAISSVGVPMRSKLTSEESEYMDYYYDKEWGWINSTFQQYCDVMNLWNRKLVDLCEKENLIYIPFAEKIPPSTKYFGDICHLRQKGIKLKAKVMAETLIPIIEDMLKLRDYK